MNDTLTEEHSNEGDSPFKWCPWPLKTEKRRLHWDRLCKLQKETNLGLIGKGLGSQNMGLGRRGNGPTMVIGPIKENPRNQIAGQEALEARRLRWRGTDRVVGADIFDKARVRVRKLYGGSDAEDETTAESFATDRWRKPWEQRGPMDLGTIWRWRQISK
ncbi:unnamed protein product [Arabidopsis thaliana]|uniref:Uncharacterized protein n=1 Tax=Arabidopsis thaliana TaxID=3702 RepID=A0A5S9WXL7_ARATH|nr:unnamed protein product [Arabidopsis thaliana]